MRVAIYTRVSTEMQVNEGSSLESQLERLKAFCVAHDWTVHKVYTDEGISAKNTERPRLQSMLKDMTKGLFDVVLVYKLDRLTRSVQDLYSLLDSFERYNVKFKSMTEAFDTTTATGRMFIGIVANLSQWERETIGERVRAVVEHKVQSGDWKGGVLAYGYYNENGQPKIDSDEREIIKFIFARIMTVGIGTIARELNQRGVPTRKGGKWHDNVIKQIVKNAFYCGYQTYGTEELYESKAYEPIITKEYWDKVQAHMTHRRDTRFRGERTPNRTYIYSGILMCSKCGSKMLANFQRNKIFRCSNKLSGGDCDSRIVQESLVDEWVGHNFDRLLEIVSKMDEPLSVVDDTSKLESLERELVRLDSLIDKENQLFRNDLIDMDTLKEKVGSYRERQKQIKVEVERLENVGDTQERMKEALLECRNNWSKFDDVTKKRYVQEVFKEIYAKSTGRMKVEVDETKIVLNNVFYDVDFDDVDKYVVDGVEYYENDFL